MSLGSIVFATINARWTHCALGLRSLLANLGPMRANARLVELTPGDRVVEMAEQILSANPSIVGLGVYVWNLRECTELARVLRCLRPDLAIVIGGPEVSFAEEAPEIVTLADVTIAGEAELAFPEVCAEILNGSAVPAWIQAPAPDLRQLALPYDLYDEDDIAHRTLYVEGSRGCPNRCEFCLAGGESTLRQFGLDKVLGSIDELWRRGARHFRFTDRCLQPAIAREMLGLLGRHEEERFFVHFELAAERLPRSLVEAIAAYPAGTLQLEVGVQTLDPDVAQRIGRQRDQGTFESNLRVLCRDTAAEIHADIIAGLPGEGADGVAACFDHLVALGVDEIQLGFLKRLRGTTIGRHAATFGMVFNPSPPYEIMVTADIAFAEMQRLKRAARVVDLVYNSGSFERTARLLWAHQSPFAAIAAFADWLWAATGQTHGISLNRLARLLYRFLTAEQGIDPGHTATTIDDDFRAAGRPPIELDIDPPPAGRSGWTHPPRQRRRRR
jgi:hypothetical protein